MISSKSKNNEYFDDKQILQWMINISDALCQIASKRLIHRDVKPK